MKHLNCALTISRWRHIAIAIDNKYLKISEALQSNKAAAQVHSLQAGHSAEVEERVYGLSMDTLVATTEHTLQLFKGISDQWHRLLVATKLPEITNEGLAHQNKQLFTRGWLGPPPLRTRIAGCSPSIQVDTTY